MESFLPKGRYRVSRGAFIIDSSGNESASSEQDLVVHDNYFHPEIFRDGASDRAFIPAESVYAVFEVKPEIKKEYVEQAQRKAREVREMVRTSGQIQHAGGVFDKPREPNRIISGLLAQRSRWRPLVGQSLKDALALDMEEGALDFGYAVEEGAFRAEFRDATVYLAEEGSDRGLLFFLTRFYAELTKQPSVPLLDILAYDQESAAASD